MNKLTLYRQNIASKRGRRLAQSKFTLYICITLKKDLEEKQNGLVVQLVRMPPCHGGGREFESRPDR